jgi:hypothetical protein
LPLLLCVTIASQARITYKKPQPDIDQNFCNTLMFIVTHVSSDFTLLKGRKLEATKQYTRYASKGKVTGTDASYIMHDTAWRYEGVLYEYTSKEKLEAYYTEYERQLECVKNANYTYSEKANTIKGLEDYPEVTWHHTGGVTICLKAGYRKSDGMYTLIVSVSK